MSIPPTPSSTPSGSAASAALSTFTSSPSLPAGDRIAGTLSSAPGLGLGATTAATAAPGDGTSVFSVPLAPGLASATAITRAGSSPSSGSGSPTKRDPATGHSASAGAAGQPSGLERIVDVIPGLVWLALGIAFAAAGLAGAAALRSSRRVRSQAGQFAAVSAAALTDSLTGVLNRRGFIDAVERELARAKRYDRPFVLAYVDVRGLKAVNDTEGHLAGDKLLQEAAHLLRDSARADDVVGRLGGDEMGLLLVEQGEDGATAAMYRIAAEVPVSRKKLGLRSDWDLTIGTATYPADGETTNDLLAVADRRLYEQRGIALS